MSAAPATAPAPAPAAADASAPAATDITPGPPPVVASFSIKETGGAGKVIFSGARLTPEQLVQVVFEPSAWDLKAPNKCLYFDSDFAHPCHFATKELVALKDFGKHKKDAGSQAKMAGKKGAAGAPKDPAAFGLDIVNGVLYSKLVGIVAGILDAAAKSGDWIIVDRVRNLAPAAELLIEAALGVTTSRPVILVIDSFQRLNKFTKEAGGANEKCLADLARVRETAKPLPAAPTTKAKSPAKPKAVEAAADPDALTLHQFYTHESFLDSKAYTGQGKPPPPTTEILPAHVIKKTGAPDPRVAWAYHYTQTIFGSGSHYLLFDEDDYAPDLRVTATTGTYVANGETKPAFERIKKHLNSGSPVVLLNNTGGVTQAFASLLKAMNENKKVDKNLLPAGALLKKITLVGPPSEALKQWQQGFGMPEIKMLQELYTKDPTSLTTKIVKLDALNDPTESVIGNTMKCLTGLEFDDKQSKKDKKAAAKQAKKEEKDAKKGKKDGGEAGADGKKKKKKGLLAFLSKKAISISPDWDALTGNDGPNYNVLGSEEEAERLKKMFDLIDRDKSGAICFDEFKAGCFLMGFLENRADEAEDQEPPDDDEMRTWFEDADADSSGRIEFGEFVALMKVEMKPKRRARRKEEKSAAIKAGAALLDPLPKDGDPKASLPAAADPLAPTTPLPPPS